MKASPRTVCTRHARLVLVSLVVLAGHAAVAQVSHSPDGSAPSPGPGWRPRDSGLNRGIFAPSFTPAERAAVIARLELIEGVFRKVSVLARPQGFEVGGYFRWIGLGRQGRPSKTEDLASYEYRLRFWSPSYAVAHDVSREIVVTVNSYATINAGLWNPTTKDSEAEEGWIFLERPRGTPVPGMPPGTVIYDQLQPAKPSFTQVLLIAGGDSVWVPVSRERYLNAEIARVSEDDKKLAAASAQTSYERWLSEAPERKKMRDQVPAETRKVMEQSEREIGEKLKAGEASEREQFQKMAAMSPTNQWRAKLAAMTPAERALPAVINSDRGAYYDFVSPDAPGATRLVALNPAFYRAKGSRVAMRSINVYFEQDVPNEYQNWAGVDRAVYETYRTLDWAALARLLEP